jgi:hypothetical protein
MTKNSKRLLKTLESKYTVKSHKLVFSSLTRTQQQVETALKFSILMKLKLFKMLLMQAMVALVALKIRTMTKKMPEKDKDQIP